MSDESGVGFCAFTVADMKGDGIMPEVREDLISAVRNGKMTCEMSLKKKEGIGSGEQVLAWFPLIRIDNFDPSPFFFFFLNIRAQFVAERRRARGVTLANL